MRGGGTRRRKVERRTLNPHSFTLRVKSMKPRLPHTRLLVARMAARRVSVALISKARAAKTKAPLSDERHILPYCP